MYDFNSNIAIKNQNIYDFGTYKKKDVCSQTSMNHSPIKSSKKKLCSTKNIYWNKYLLLPKKI